MALERRPASGRLNLLEAVDEIVCLRIEERELLLDCDGEIGGVLEPLARLRDQLLGRDTLLLTHGRTTLNEALTGSD